MRSSYIQNNYGEVFELITRAYHPLNAVELGVLDGYSTLHICKGLKELRERFGSPGHLNSYDIWEDYPYNHGNMQEVQQMLDDNGLHDYVTLHKKDAFEVYKDYADRSVDLLHVDLSNDGTTLRTIMEQWDKKMIHNGLILFEGGSIERDNVEWMHKYNKVSIRKEIRENPIINRGVGWWAVGTYEKFPSLTLLYKRFDEIHLP